MRKLIATMFMIFFVSMAYFSIVNKVPETKLTGVKTNRAGTNPAIYPTVPGAINMNVNQDNIQTTICKSGWTKTIRPPTSYTNNLKLQQLDNDDRQMAGAEEDHLISLQLAGNPTNPQNLWPQPYIIYSNGMRAGAREKDVVETALKREVCNYTITLKKAQGIIVQDWFACYLKIKNKQVCL